MDGHIRLDVAQYGVVTAGSGLAGKQTLCHWRMHIAMLHIPNEAALCSHSRCHAAAWYRGKGLHEQAPVPWPSCVVSTSGLGLPWIALEWGMMRVSHHGRSGTHDGGHRRSLFALLAWANACQLLGPWNNALISSVHVCILYSLLVRRQMRFHVFGESRPGKLRSGTSPYCRHRGLRDDHGLNRSPATLTQKLVKWKYPARESMIASWKMLRGTPMSNLQEKGFVDCSPRPGTLCFFFGR